MSAEEPTRRLAAILAADIVSYTRLVGGRLDVRLIDGGKRTLKNVARPVRVTKLARDQQARAACHYWLAAALADAGRVADAKLHAEATLKVEPTFRARDPMLMHLYLLAADRERMANALERAGFPR